MRIYNLLFDGTILGGTGLIAYLGRCISRGRAPRLASALEILISALGMAGGLKGCVVSYSAEFRVLLNSVPQTSSYDAFFFLIGGFAVVWISLQALLKRIDKAP